MGDAPDYEEEEFEDSSGSESSDSESDEEEPKLKYQRLGGTVETILKSNTAACLCVNERFVALGTRAGSIHILDFEGNENKSFAPHSGPINELAVDDTGEYIGSCSEDGTVLLTSLFSGEAESHRYRRPILALAIDPDFHRKNTRQFVCGGRAGQLLKNTKGFLGIGTKNVVLHSGEGPIYTIKWRRSLIAWANDRGVKIYDCDSNQRITYIDRPKGSPRPDLYKCHLAWDANSQILIGWADCIKIGQIKERDTTQAGLPSRYVEIIAWFQADYYVCGLAPFGEYLVVLAYPQSEEDPDAGLCNAQIGLQPELRVVTRTSEEISADALPIRGHERNQANDYRLDFMDRESLFYIVSPYDIVVAKPCDINDHLEWLLKKEKYEEALRTAEINTRLIKSHALSDIGQKYLGHLLSKNEVVKAAQLCPKILGNDATLWESWIFRFAKSGHLSAISPFIPVKQPTLSSMVYEMVLNDFLRNDHRGFLRTIRAWPHSLYNIENIITAVTEEFKKTCAEDLMDALAELYTFAGKYDKTLGLYLRLGRGPVFELIEKHDLYSAIQQCVRDLMKFDSKRAVELLAENTDRLPIAHVVKQLSGNPEFLHWYLHGLFKKDPHIAHEFHEYQIELYAKYDYTKLLPFLRQSNYYPLEKALAICEQRCLYPEMVFILGRMGNHKQALHLLIDQIGDVKQAIDYVQSVNDEELWDDLITKSMQKPAFVSALLEHIGGHVDPIKLIKRIPEGLEIEGLRDRLVKIISDFNLQMSLREGCNLVLKADCVDLMERLYTRQKSAMLVDTQGSRCALCSGAIGPSSDVGGIFVFFCSHVFHQRCIRLKHQPASGEVETPAAAPLAASTTSPSMDLGLSPVTATDTLTCTICQTSSAS